MKPLLRVLSLSCCFLLAACSSNLVPTAQMSQVDREEQSDACLLSQLEADWMILSRKSSSQQARDAAYARYNENLLRLVRRARHDLHEALDDETYYEAEGFVIRQESPRGIRKGKKLVHLRDRYEDIVPAADVKLEELEEHYQVDGLGVPLVGIIPAKNVDQLVDTTTVSRRGTVRTLTAVMTFPTEARKARARAKGRVARPVLKLIPRATQENIEVGQRSYPLAGDITATLEIYWNLTGVKEWRFMGLLSPQKLRSSVGLSCIEQYDPNRIPVILTHGLASSPLTFSNMVNRLMNDPDIRRRYQFWYFGYPTGVSWIFTAQSYRKALREARDRLDPERKNKNWDKKVLVGHSMGGLITHYSQCEESWQMMRPVLKKEAQDKYLHAKYLDAKVINPEMEKMQELYFFRPVKAGRVVYLATPHRGAPMAARNLVESVVRGLVSLPTDIVEESVKMLTLHEDLFILNPSQAMDWYTSVAQLSPTSPSIWGLQYMRVRNVPTHSVIGDRGKGDSPHGSDGVVPYWSSHIAWGKESIVGSGHSVQDIVETAEIMRLILLEHLDSMGIPRSKAK